MKPFYKITRLIRNLSLLVHSLVSRSPERVRQSVPYKSQFANPAWAEMVIKDGQPLNKDILWPDSGAKTIEEYEHWALSACGMACASMIIAFFKKKDFKVIKLARDAMKSGVYTESDGKISEMNHRSFVTWIKKFNIKATIYSKLSLRSIHHLLSKNNLIIASVNPNIQGYNTVPNTQIGGHLVLVTGYNKAENTITIHNPSGFENNQSQVNHTVSVKEWNIYFTGHGIALRNVN